MNTNVVGAIFKRNFFSYFNSPTGYVFICVFVALSSLAAFWPNDFFNANLDNLDQLNKYLPFILLVFIPAITMSIWADERRQGTDELLLTIPATDFDVVVGKYLAAVAIYSVALVFSLVCNFLVLEFLGNPDLGLLLATYVGYWVVGLAMLSIGMVASFLTSNLTVGFVLGAAFNAPLVFMAMADVIVPLQLGRDRGEFQHCRAVPRFQPGCHQPAERGLFRLDRGGDAVSEHGAHRPPPLARPARQRGLGRALLRAGDRLGIGVDLVGGRLWTHGRAG